MPFSSAYLHAHLAFVADLVNIFFREPVLVEGNLPALGALILFGDVYLKS